MNSSAFDLLSRGRAAAKSGEMAEARRYLEWALRMDPSPEERQEALYWLSEASDDPREKRSLLEEILANNLGDARARRKLAILDGKLKPADIVDPDRLQPQAPGAPRDAAAQSFTCPRCGGRMSYTPDGSALTCEYCEATGRLGGAQAAPEGDFLVAMATARGHRRPVTLHQITCHGCGCPILLPAEAISRTCPYCATPYAIDEAEELSLDSPDALLPFTVTAGQAYDALREWLQDASLEGRVRVARPQGIYLPAWIFDLGGQITWSGRIYKNKRWLPVSGARVVSRGGLLVPATRRLPDDLQKAFYSFDLSGLRPYEPGYLADWLAETFSVPAGDASLDARSAALEIERGEVRLVEMENVEDLKIDSHGMLVEGYRLALLPFWIGYYLVEDQRFDAVINGCSGRVFAQRPDSGLSGWLKNLF